MERFALLACLALPLFACSGASPIDSPKPTPSPSSTSIIVPSPAPREAAWIAQRSRSITLTKTIVFGGADPCRVRTLNYDSATKGLRVECKSDGTPAVDRVLTDVEATMVERALSNLEVAPTPVCALDAPMIAVSIGEADGTTKSFRDDFVCNDPGTRVIKTQTLNMLIRELSILATPAPATAIWNEHAKSITFAQTGRGIFADTSECTALVYRFDAATRTVRLESCNDEGKKTTEEYTLTGVQTDIAALTLARVAPSTGEASCVRESHSLTLEVSDGKGSIRTFVDDRHAGCEGNVLPEVATDPAWSAVIALGRPSYMF